MKKWLCFLLAFGLMTTPVFAADDDDDDEEWEDEEDEAPKKSSKKAAPAPAKKVTKPSGAPSRMGLAVSFSGFNITNEKDKSGSVGAISFVYDLGSGVELGLGLGLNRIQYAEQGDYTPDPTQILAIVGSFSYNLGKGLLDYGIGVDVGLTMEPEEEGGNSINGFPYFYAKTDVVPNISLKLSAGINVYKPSGDLNSPNNMIIDLRAQGSVILYFL